MVGSDDAEIGGDTVHDVVVRAVWRPEVRGGIHPVGVAQKYVVAPQLVGDLVLGQRGQVGM